MKVIIPNKGIEKQLGRGGGGTITINGVLQRSSGNGLIHHSSGVEVSRIGERPYVVLNVGPGPLAIQWDDSHQVDITVSSKW